MVTFTKTMGGVVVALLIASRHAEATPERGGSASDG